MLYADKTSLKFCTLISVKYAYGFLLQVCNMYFRGDLVMQNTYYIITFCRCIEHLNALVIGIPVIHLKWC